MIWLVDELRDIVGPHMHVQAGLAFVRDAWTASRFAKARAADAVRLWPGDRPDCELTFQNRRELFEIVEADQPGRKRSAEYRDLIRRREQGEREEAELDEGWQSRAAMAPEMLRRAATSKATKGYDPDVGLIIHLNLMEYGFKGREIEAAMQACTAPAKDAFREVWVLWQQITYPLWRHGEPLPPDRFPKRDDEDDYSISDADLWKSIMEDDWKTERNMAWEVHEQNGREFRMDDQGVRFWLRNTDAPDELPVAFVVSNPVLQSLGGQVGDRAESEASFDRLRPRLVAAAMRKIGLVERPAPPAPVALRIEDIGR